MKFPNFNASYKEKMEYMKDKVNDQEKRNRELFCSYHELEMKYKKLYLENLALMRRLELLEEVVHVNQYKCYNPIKKI